MIKNRLLYFAFLMRLNDKKNGNARYLVLILTLLNTPGFALNTLKNALLNKIME